MKKIIFFLFLLIVLSGCQVINQPVDNQNNSQDNNLAVDDSVKACQTDSGASLTLEEALAIANDSTCVQEGAVKEDCNCNATTGTCWLDMDVEGHEGCNPACVVNIETGEAEALGSVDGQKMSPRFSPHGDHIILSSAKKGATALYKMDLKTKQFEKITSTTSTIDVSPCYSPDETKIVFISDRGGQPQIYVRDAGGSNDTRISFSTGRYDNPVWSPRGDLIAFTRQNGGTFYIGVMRPDGSGERMLDSGYLLEGPTWSPNGREVMYTCQDSTHGKVGLCSIDIVGFHKRKVNIPGEGSYPTW